MEEKKVTTGTVVEATDDNEVINSDFSIYEILMLGLSSDLTLLFHPISNPRYYY